MNNVQSLLTSLSQIKPRELDIPSDSRKALRRLLDVAEYNLEICRTALDRVLMMCNKAPQQTILVDYCGGAGVLSFLAKMSGFGRVIYVDSSPDAVKTVHELSRRLDVAPDVVIEGGSEMLARWCRDKNIVPDALVSVDVIQQVYVLDELFADIHSMAPRIKMVFTTISNPFNKKTVRRLHKAMDRNEKGHGLTKGYRQMRRDYIHKIHSDMPDRLLDFWADNTRGLKYDDVARAIEAQAPNLLLDPHNTCDPATGLWTDRVMPVDDYSQLLQPYGWCLLVLPGRCNVHCHGPKAWIRRRRNKRIDRAPKEEPDGMGERRRMRRALKVAPFIYLIIE